LDAPIVSIARNPTPKGVRAQFLTLAEGVRLRTLIWTADSAGISQPRGTLFLFQGRAEFTEKYFEVIAELLARNFAVATMDWRGQGLSQRMLSDPRKGHVDDFASYLRDVDGFMAYAAPLMPKPHIALAHSMGAHILLRAAHDRPQMFSAIALSSPMLELLLGKPSTVTALRLLASVLVGIGAGKRYVPGGTGQALDKMPFDGNILTSDAKRYARTAELVTAEPLLALGAPTLSWIDAAFHSLRITSDPGYLRDIRLPVLLIGAGADRLVDQNAIRHAAELIPDARYVGISDARHEILMEQDYLRAQFWNTFDEFLKGLS
jgi:lysophospholipase